MEKHIFNIEDATHHLQRIDKILPEFNSEWSRSQLQEWIKEGLI
ncbi:RluA family pseudouridine synthase, partial [Staphylococcus pseudintermedius]|nr:RluA family pseudouridine synthase [Staphylococcus pseudintermedius]